MKILIVLIGMQGAGKTSALNAVKYGVVLKPSTARAKRSDTEDDYHFETAWNQIDYAWTIDRNGVNYGMRKEEFGKITDIGITVFDPANINSLQQFKTSTIYEVVTVGIDTIESLADQNVRVNNDSKRTIAEQVDFDSQRSVVRECDVVLNGNSVVVADALNAIISILVGRGGLLNDKAIKSLVNAGTLLENIDFEMIQSASYDLKLADKYWCQGKYITLDDKNPTAEIPPYSFILVQAKEFAILPRFIAASFDTTVTLFMNGVILSNGPQVDPGYRGALFCMLYNTSDTSMGVTRGKHFATIQFCTTTLAAGGYEDKKYQGKKSFEDFLDGKTSKGPGGKILERISEVKTDLLAWRNLMSGIIAIASAVAFGTGLYSYNMGSKADGIATKADGIATNTEKMSQRAEDASLRLEQLMTKFQAIQTSTVPQSGIPSGAPLSGPGHH